MARFGQNSKETIAAPYSYPSDVIATLTSGHIKINGVPCAEALVIYHDGHIEHRFEAWSDIIAGHHPLPNETLEDDYADELTGYHNVRTSDL